MNQISLTYQQWLLLFEGASAVILAANFIQWVVSRDRIYALYSGYILLWSGFFGFVQLLSPFLTRVVASVFLPVFSILFVELAVVFLNLKAQPRQMRWFRAGQWAMIGVAALELYFYFFTSFWQTPWHEYQLNVSRIITLLLTAYVFVVYARAPNRLASFFIAGTGLLLLGEMVGVALVLRYGIGATTLPMPYNGQFLMQVAILCDIVSVSLGLSYRQRQQAVQRVLVEQELDREREQRLRQQLEADLTLQQLKQQHTDAQMKALQSQVNPHFLFNSLNTLSSLIDENPPQAITYVDELSSVYRYLLRASDRELTPLSVELSFIQSYFHLLKTRYDSSICPEIDVAEEHTNALVPPLTLQLLVENAVKHNRALPEEPLTIRIRTTAMGQLAVENNIQRRNVRVESNGVGLANIADKYCLLNQPAPLIEEVEGWFRVTLPLLKPLDAAAPSHLVGQASGVVDKQPQ
ncbi:sensor histidine kinase [Hymenobacter sp. GOD-10R]|uniref:sensor histidine kinase n=1 Tax=Hymenobacter sp. GOD-10R TaxID=3093922 RepID=UPI002D76AA1F|nr:histidine kinase [Hymenobacter sp. GOD-10R]WRQ30133.1 histidine kinase [Hymenobacter sp. GOD-10R]